MRYPSEKKKLERQNKILIVPADDIVNKEDGFWRISKLGVPVGKDPGKDFLDVSLPLLDAIAKVLKFPVAKMLPPEAFTVIRKSFDARKVLKESQFVYIVDMDVKKLLDLEPRTWDFISRLEPRFGLVEYMASEKVCDDVVTVIHDWKSKNVEAGSGNGINATNSKFPYRTLKSQKPKVVIVGSGPSGLFASLVLGEVGADVTLIERGQAVEKRGRDIGALVARKILQSESNFCFGEVHGVMENWSLELEETLTVFKLL